MPRALVSLGEWVNEAYLFWQPESNRDRRGKIIGVRMSQPDLSDSNSQQQYQNVTVLSNVALPNNHFGDFGWGWACDRVALYHVHQLYTGVQSFRTCEVWTHHAGGSTVGTHVAHIALVAHFWTLPQFASCPTFRPQTHTQSFHWIRAHCCASNHVAFGIVLCAQKLAMREVRCTLPLYELPGQSHCHLHSCYFLPLWAQL